MSVVDRDYGDKREDYEALVTSGLCVLCRETESLPDDELCRDCLAECVGEVELENLEATHGSS